MKNFILISSLLICNLTLAKTKNEYTFTIIDLNNQIVSNQSVQIIYESDTLFYVTNNKGEITLNIRYSYPCTTGARHGIFSNPLRNVSPTYSSAPITIIFKERKSSLTKNWDSYFDKPKKLQKDIYNYHTGQLIE